MGAGVHCKAGSLGAEPSLEPGCGGNGVGGARADEPEGPPTGRVSWWCAALR